MITELLAVDQAFEGPAFVPSEQVIVWAQTGSVSHNTHTSLSDRDRMGVILPPKEYLIGLHRWDCWENKVGDMDAKLWSLQKYVPLALKGNPDVLALLWLREEDYIIRGDAWRALIEIRDAFSSRQAYNAFTGYAKGQIARAFGEGASRELGARRREALAKFQYDRKAAAHALRLVAMVAELMDTGKLNVYRTHDAEILRQVKRGDLPAEDVKNLIFAGLDLATAAWIRTSLPNDPDTKKIEEVLMSLVMDQLTR